MSNNLKRQVIHHLAEQGVPADYNPWEEVKGQLESNQAGRKTMRHSGIDAPLNLSLKVRFAGVLTMLLVLLVGTVFFLTPQGQVTANNLFQLFRRAESNVLPLPTGLPTESILPTSTPFPTQIIGLQSVPTEEPGVFFTPTPKEKTEQGTITYGLTISEAEELAQFAIRAPNSLPSGYRLSEVTFDSQTRAVQQIYKYFPYQSGEMFVLSQEPSQPTDSVGQNAQIDQIQVGDITVEAVNGSWFSAAGSNQEEWINNAPVHTFRWQQDGFTFTLQFLVGDTFSSAYLSKDDMQAVVETVIGTLSAFPESMNLNNLASVEEVEQAAGFQLLAPTLLPEGFALERAVYEPENKRAVFIYRPKDTAGSMNHPSLIIFEILKDGDTLPAIYPEELPPEAIEQVTIDTASGTLVRGAVVDGTYDPNFGLSLHWETDNLSITINYSGTSSHPAQLEKADMIEIAEGLQ